MKNELLVLFSMTLSGCIVYLYSQIKDKLTKRQLEMIESRWEHLQHLVQSGLLHKEVIYYDNDESRLKMDKMKNIYIDNKKYTDRTSWCAVDDDGVLWIIGKKENFIIECHMKKLKEWSESQYGNK